MALSRCSSTGVIAGDAHIVADALGDGFVDDVPLALGALIGVDVVLILDHHALAAGLLEERMTISEACVVVSTVTSVHCIYEFPPNASLTRSKKDFFCSYS